MCKTYRICRLLMRPNISRCPAEYCSMTSFTSYGRSVSLNFLLATRNFKILHKNTNTPDSLLTLLREPLKSLAQHIHIYGRTVNLWKMRDSYQMMRETLRITRLITVRVTLSFTNSPIKRAESPPTKPCEYIVMMTTSPRDICFISTCCFSKSTDSNV